MSSTIAPQNKKELMRLFDVDYHGWVEEDEPYFLCPPDGWKVSHELAPWVIVSPEDNESPRQGWKVHISTVPDTAQQALAVVSEIAFASGTPFKYLSGVAELRRMSGKYADRGSAGKFVALYPREECLTTLLGSLENALEGFEGPYILSDVQYGSSPVYVRYGGFINICDVDADGTERLCLQNPDGGLVEDKRGPILWLPDFVDVPECLREAVNDRLNPTDDSLDRLLEGYELVDPIHFSNGGGVYLLRRTDDGAEVIMKEGRPSAGWDPRGTDAVGRVRREATTLKALIPTGAVPAFFGLRSAGGHLFLFEEKVGGDDLHSWTANNYPHAGGAADRENYANKALAILGHLERAVDAAHRLGIALMDLQPQNIIVTPENEIRLIDLESACSVGDKKPQACIGTPGYVPAARFYTPLERDSYAMFQIGLGLFHPAAGVSSLSDEAAQNVEKIIGELFPPPVAVKLAELREMAKPVMVRTFLSNPAVRFGNDVFGEGLGGREMLERAVEGLHLVRVEREIDAENPSFYPLVDASYSGVRQLAIEHGLSGIMLALGARDLNAEEDLVHLEGAALNVRRAGSGLMNGMLGICLVLASRGRHQEAVDLYVKHCKKNSSHNNISLRSGLSGQVLGALVLADIVHDDGLRSCSLGLLSRLRATLIDPPKELYSPECFTQDPLGLFDGWSGAALALATAAHMLREPALYEESVQAIRLDMQNMITVRDGSLQAVDGSRTMPYFADGSAGLAFALSAVPRHYRIHYDRMLDAVSKACNGSCVLPGLYHGLSGLILVSALLTGTQGSKRKLVPELWRLSPFLMCPSHGKSILLPGDDREHLSVDFANGSAGLVFALRFMQANSNLIRLPGYTESWNLSEIIAQLEKGGE